MTNYREGAGLGIRTEDQVTDRSCIRWEEKREELIRRGNYSGKRKDDKEGRWKDFTLELIGVRRADTEGIVGISKGR
jgi:hypothetical protein